MRRLLAVLIVIAAAQFLGGCAVLGYYSQSALGHLDVMFRSRPIDQWLADESTEPELRAHLQQVLAMRQFAITSLLLPDNGSYLDYADLERSHVVWNVFATPELSLQPIKSCFLVVGCLSYRGYFSKEDAEQQAERLAAEGNDVFVGGVAAYSTLGWFKDPVLNTMLKWSEPRLASVLFHELAHQKLYVDDHSAFNEAFATAVGEIGVKRWLDKQNDREAMRAWQVAKLRKQDFLALVTRAAEQLRALYARDLDTETMRAEKQSVYAELRSRHEELKQTRWAGYQGYDHWFETVNNARISAVSTYHRWVPAFMNILQAHEGDLAGFYAECAAAVDMTRAERTDWLKTWLAGVPN